jgi:hypothetical protein
MELATLCLDLNYKLAPSAAQLTRDQISFLMAALRTRAESAEIEELAAQGVTRIVFRGEE